MFFYFVSLRPVSYVSIVARFSGLPVLVVHSAFSNVYYHKNSHNQPSDMSNHKLKVAIKLYFLINVYIRQIYPGFKVVPTVVI